MLLYVLILLNRQFHYEVAEITPGLLVLLLGMQLALGLALWKEWLWQRGEDDFVVPMLLALAATLGLAGMFHPNWSNWNQLYEYRGAIRWSGPFKNPNQFGLLMALGLVLVTGLPVLYTLQEGKNVGRLPDKEAQERDAYETSRGWIFLLGLLILSVALLLLINLVKSYSRGAWLSALSGLSYLAFSWQKMRLDSYSLGKVGGVAWLISAPKRWSQAARSFRKNIASLLIALSMVIMSFWLLRHTNIPVIRRAFSAGNV